MQISLEGSQPRDDHPLHYINRRKVPSAKIEERNILFQSSCDHMEQRDLNTDDQCVVQEMKERLPVKNIIFIILYSGNLARKAEGDESCKCKEAV